jgi:hypothetical protein
MWELPCRRATSDPGFRFAPCGLQERGNEGRGMRAEECGAHRRGGRLKEVVAVDGIC